jgi:hypothetical protein
MRPSEYYAANRWGTWNAPILEIAVPALLNLTTLQVDLRKGVRCCFFIGSLGALKRLEKRMFRERKKDNVEGM